jgi:hypothetical protein
MSPEKGIYLTLDGHPLGLEDLPRMSTADPIQVAEIEVPLTVVSNNPPRSRVWQVAFRFPGPREGSAANRPDERHSVCPWVQIGRWCHGWDTGARERRCVGVRNCLRIGQGRARGRACSA